ncbi:MAG: response regulator transcription factor [Bradymonadia bacterium]
MDDTPHILIVEDDAGVAQGLVHGLRQARFRTTLAINGEQGLQLVLTQSFDLVLLDLMLPGRTGFEVLKAMCTRVSVPTIVLSALSDLPARLKSFENGAVDFVPKPFFIEELVARIRSRLEVRQVESRRLLELGDTLLDLDARIVLRDEQDLGMTGYEFNVLAFLCIRAGRAQTRGQIAEHALSEHGDCSDRTVDSHISRIRKKLGPDTGGLIKTIWGIGYRCDVVQS